MKKIPLITLFLVFVLMLAPVTSSAESYHDHTEEFQTETSVGQVSDLYHDLIDPLSIECGYYPGGHRHVLVNTSNREVYDRKHDHYDSNSGITFRDCEIYKVYSVSHYACVCGDRYTREVYREERHYYG